MKKYFNITILFIIIFLLVLIPVSAKIDIGGEVNTSLVGILDNQGNISGYLQESLDLELFLPSFDDTQAKYEIYLYNHPLSGGFDYLLKKLYLKHKFEKFHLTVGRQPISWSFGSMLNPVDFSLGAMVMDEETGSKYQNAIEAYYPINWNSSITAIAAFPNGFENMKWGLRGRTMLEGYDLTLNYVREPEENSAETMIPVSQRIGISAKGDLGPFGIYGALGYYFKDNDDGDLAYLIGGDYSYFFEAGNKIYFQLEYLSIKKDNLFSILGSFFSGNITNNLDNQVGLLLGLLNYEINEFSQVSLMAISSLNDGSMIIMPGYHNQLNNNLSFNLNMAIYSGKEGTLFGSTVSEVAQQMPKGMIEVGLSYSF
ncbi:MAG: hypothetical protein CO097_05180 [Candidatus Infernicultor aquiphilus]|uniref:Porin domain-containing protein n=1 Tax=Candidatus Infernicultor aquiphilus TaxID=1805029 RepID=A0A2M8CBQ0_9BACT|nr:MAG: hypothetical protein CO097_05180 [Candidatus Atribacteria bacterium CG_4_9_14_3_um_filter_33_16]